MTDEEKQFLDHVALVRAKMDAAAAGRPYTLLAASKTQSAERINLLPQCGIYDYGENRVQEWMEKQEKIIESLRFHQIGRLQTNKIKYIIEKVYLIHSLDREDLAQELSKAAAKHGKTVRCLIQVNPAMEEQKGGVSVEELMPFYEKCRALPNLAISGLMCMAPNTQEECIVHEVFAKARECFETLQKQDAGIDILSMGMSQDAHIALQEGSTLIRLGTSLFGSRNYP